MLKNTELFLMSSIGISILYVIRKFQYECIEQLKNVENTRINY